MRKNKWVVASVAMALALSVSSSVAFAKDVVNTNGDVQWVRYSSLDSGSKLVEMFVHGNGFRITGDGSDHYGYLLKSGTGKREYNLKNNYGGVVAFSDGGIVKSVKFSATTIVLNIINQSSSEKTMRVLQEIDS